MMTLCTSARVVVGLAALLAVMADCASSHETFASSDSIKRGQAAGISLLQGAYSLAAASSAAQGGSGGEEEPSSLLQQPARPKVTSPRPHLVSLRRESVPIYRRGKVASFKTSYSGVLSVGTPAQEFRVVFDTGSAHIVLPAAECQSESCLVHRRFNMTASSTAIPINQDGGVVPEGELCDQVTIGFGTGQITGEFAKDKVCFEQAQLPVDRNKPPADGFDLSATAVGVPASDKGEVVGNETVGMDHQPPLNASSSLCVDMHVVLAVEMSSQPFKTFQFDGILGLSLQGLALSDNFSVFDTLLGQGMLGSPHFGVFLTEGDEGEDNEIALGGHNPERLLEPLTWAPVAMADLGYWQVEIVAVRVNGETLDFCKDGTCRGVVDTGTSHLGIPAPFDAEIASLVTTSAGDLLDCRLAEAPEIEIEVHGKNISLHPHNYMRRLPLREGVTVGSAQGVYVPSEETNKTLGAPSSADAVPVESGSKQGNASNLGNSTALQTNSSTEGSESGSLTESQVRRYCRPRLMPVRLPEPLGPKLFILGEPVLHRYYTVFDWTARRVGFGLANNLRNSQDPSEIVDRRGVLPKEVDMLLMQTKSQVARREAASSAAAAPPSAEKEVEEAIFVQVRVRLTPLRQSRRQTGGPRVRVLGDLTASTGGSPPGAAQPGLALP